MKHLAVDDSIDTRVKADPRFCYLQIFMEREKEKNVQVSEMEFNVWFVQGLEVFSREAVLFAIINVLQLLRVFLT